MAMSASLARRELDVQRYPLLVVVLVPLAAIFLQVLIPRFVPKFDILDLPLLVTIYFSVGWRNPIAGTVTGAVIGLVQDALTSRPLGINGISQCVVGFFRGQDRRGESGHSAADQFCLHLVEYRDLSVHHASHAGVQCQYELAA
jgi:rod shape-determining protein MreD